jgi:hypothetical protein
MNEHAIVSCFVEYFNLNFSNTEIQSFMNLLHFKRKLDLTSDAFLLVTSFLDMSSCIALVTSCKEFIDCYYIQIWSGLHEYLRFFPNSIISKNDYVSIRKNIGLYYYHIVLNNSTSKGIIKYIIDDDRSIHRLLMETPIKNSLHDVTNNAQMCVHIKNRQKYYNLLPTNIQTILLNFQWLSPYYENNLRLTHEALFDMQAFGVKDIKHWQTEDVPWILGGYSAQPVYNYDDEQSKDDKFQYFTSLGDLIEDQYVVYAYKQRIIPIWYQRHIHSVIIAQQIRSAKLKHIDKLQKLQLKELKTKMEQNLRRKIHRS